jgi:hypothetical protein
MVMVMVMMMMILLLLHLILIILDVRYFQVGGWIFPSGSSWFVTWELKTASGEFDPSFSERLVPIQG